jgi:hypothetical protein
MKNVFIAFGFTLVSLFSNAQSIPPTDSNLTPKIDTILVNRNDKRYFEAEYDSKNILKFKEVSGILDSAKTLSIELTFGDAMGTMLKIFNPFSEKLVYKAELYSYKKKDYLETSTVPVFPKISSFETWPYKIDQIRLTGFKIKTH